MIPSLSLRQKARSRFAEEEEEEEEEEEAAGGAAPQKTHIHSTYMSATGDNKTFPSLLFFSSSAGLADIILPPNPPLSSPVEYCNPFGQSLLEYIYDTTGLEMRRMHGGWGGLRPFMNTTLLPSINK